MSEAIQLTGLWKSDKPTRAGKPYYKGKVKETVTIEAGSMVCLFKNEPKEGYDSLPANAPPFTVTVLPPLEQSRPADRHYGDNGQSGQGEAPWEEF
jgi:hypothetical protein